MKPRMGLVTGLAAFVCIFFIFKDFFLVRKLFLYTDIGGDSFYGEWPILAYIGSSLQEGTLSFWTHSFGIGTNILTLNHYLFDPFNWPMYFVNKEALTLLLPYVVSVKILAANFFFYLYLSTFNFKKYTVSLFSLLFAFCGYMVIWGRFLPFGTAVVYLAMILYAFEVWFTAGKKTWLILAITMLAVFSHYFLFFITFFIGIYAIVRRLGSDKSTARDWISYIGRLSYCYLIALGLGAPILFPSVMVTLASPRVGGVITNFFSVNSPEYYLALLSRFFSNHIAFAEGHFFYEALNYFETPNVYCGLVPLLLIPQLFSRFKEWSSRSDLMLFIFVVLLLVLPFFADALNLFSYRQYRWTFIVAPVILLLAAKALNGIDKTGEVNNKLLIATSFMLSLILLGITAVEMKRKTSALDLFAAISLNWSVFVYLFCYMALIFALQFIQFKKIAKFGLYSLVLIEIMQHSVFDIRSNRTLIEPEYMNKQGFFDDTNEAIRKIESIDSGFFRVSKSYMSGSWGDPAAQGYNGTTSYLSVNSPGYLSFLQKFNNEYPNKNVVKLPVDRLELNSLLGVKYHLSLVENDRPYGYEYLDKVGSVYIYKNRFALPIAIFYDSYIRDSEFEKLDSVERDVVVIKSVIVGNDSLPAEMTEYSSQPKLVSRHPAELKVEAKTQISNLKIINDSFPNEFEFEALAINPIIYFSSRNSSRGIYELEFEIESPVDTFGQLFWKNDVENFMESKSKYFQIAKGKKVYYQNLGNTIASAFRMDISADKDTFKIAGLKLRSTPVPFDSKGYEQAIGQLQRSSFIVSRFGNSLVEGRMTTPTKGILALSVPFDLGWNIYVDGQLGSLSSINGGIVGTVISKGVHTIKLKFVPRMLFEGMLVFLLTVIFLIVNTNLNLKRQS